jgi:predicted nucleic acid-binding protein
MPAFFLDTSALVKRYVMETGTAWVVGLTDTASGNRCWASDLARVELLSALYRRVRAGALDPADAQRAEGAFDADRRTHFRLLAVTPEIVTRAVHLVTAHPLRANDGIQLATAHYLAIRSQAIGLGSPIFVSADRSLNQIATLIGLQVDDPNLHP